MSQCPEQGVGEAEGQRRDARVGVVGTSPETRNVPSFLIVIRCER